MLEFPITLEHTQQQFRLKGSLKEIKSLQILQIGQTGKV